MKRKIHLVLAVTAAVFALAIPAIAYTVPYDITIPYDTISPRSSKDDDEQSFYVSGYSFSHYAAGLYCISQGIDSPGVWSNSAWISSIYPSDSASYLTYAPYDEWYYMQSYSYDASDFHVLGYYTP